MADLSPQSETATFRPRIALCLEYPLLFQGGVSVLVRELQKGLSERFDMVIVSPDRDAQSAGLPPGSQHVFWDPASVSRKESMALANRLAALGVRLAHFHMGGNYGWGNRFPEQSPIVHTARLGIAVMTSSHLVDNIFAGYCGTERSFWFKLCMLPLAWIGKMQALWYSRVEIAVSCHDFAKLARWYAPLRRRFRMLYHSCLDPAAVPGDPMKREQTILAVGHIAFRKGQHILTEAFAKVAKRYPGWKLQLAGPIGEPECLDAIQAIAAKENLTARIEILGARDDAWALMQRAGIFVQPSRLEALGLALQEALYCGCPAIGTRAGGIPELLDEDTTGLLVPPDDPGAMASALDQLLGDPDRRARFASAARGSIERKGMTSTQMLDVHAKIYDAILHGL